MLSPEQLKFYQENGYLHVKGLFTREEAAAFRQEAHALIDRLQKISTVEATWESAREVTMTKTSLLHCHDVQFQSALLTRLIVDERLTGVAADIIGTPNVQLHHNKLFIKPPEKGSPFPMHQDRPFFPHDKDSMIAAIIHFDDAPLAKGCVRVVPGSHKLGPIEHLQTGGWHLPLEQYPIESSVACEAEAGDVLFFSYLTIHGSGVNVSNEARTTLLVQMRDPLDPPSVLTHLSRGQGMMLRGVDPSTGKATPVGKEPHDAPAGGTMAGGTMAGGTMAGGTMAGGTMAGGTMAGGTMAGGTMG
jgi:ectoine hydroxylase-related dioxygenase (phytanoyl-CoA dioxygenase family)